MLRISRVLPRIILVVTIELKHCQNALNIAFQHFLLSVSGGKSSLSGGKNS